MEEKENTRKIRIMIADDFPLLVEDLCELIERQEDMEVAGTANSGKKIVELAKNTEFDIILMDIEMPKMNGFETFSRIKDLGDEIPVIFLTASGMEDDVVSAIRLGAVNYLKKPYLPQELQKRVSQEFERQ